MSHVHPPVRLPVFPAGSAAWAMPAIPLPRITRSTGGRGVSGVLASDTGQGGGSNHLEDRYLTLPPPFLELFSGMLSWVSCSP